MICSMPMAIVYYALGFHFKKPIRQAADRLRTHKVFLIAAALLMFAIEIPLALCDYSPNLAIPEFHAFVAFPVASILGIAAVLSLSASPLAGAALQFVGRFSLYYFMLERWSQAAWMAICKAWFPSFLPAVLDANTNVNVFSPAQIALFLTFIVLFETAVIPLLRQPLDWCKRRFG